MKHNRLPFLCWLKYALCIPHSDNIWGLGVFQFPESAAVIMPMICTDTPDSELWIRLDYDTSTLQRRAVSPAGIGLLNQPESSVRGLAIICKTRSILHNRTKVRQWSHLHIDAATLNWQTHLPARQKINQSSEAPCVCQCAQENGHSQCVCVL